MIGRSARPISCSRTIRRHIAPTTMDSKMNMTNTMKDERAATLTHMGMMAMTSASLMTTRQDTQTSIAFQMGARWLRVRMIGRLCLTRSHTLSQHLGVSMGFPFIKRRSRPLTMRLASLTLIVVVIVTGLLSIMPLGSASQPGVSSFAALSGAVVLTSDKPAYFWYTARLNDTIDQVAARLHVQIGGILEINGLCPGLGLEYGKPYKIPGDPQYGASYVNQPPAACAKIDAPAGYGLYGQTVFGTSWWNSFAGIPSEEGKCSTTSGSNFLDFKFTSPNWNSNWVRGFTFFHDGDDIAAPQGNPVHAVQSGQIIWAGYDATNGFGWSVVINHCYHVSSLYGHMMGLAPGIKAGVNVSQGQVLGYEGMTGWATGPHVHLSIMWNNAPIDPMLFYRSIYDLTHYVPNP